MSNYEKLLDMLRNDKEIDIVHFAPIDHLSYHLSSVAAIFKLGAILTGDINLDVLIQESECRQLFSAFDSSTFYAITDCCRKKIITLEEKYFFGSNCYETDKKFEEKIVGAVVKELMANKKILEKYLEDLNPKDHPLTFWANQDFKLRIKQLLLSYCDKNTELYNELVLEFLI